MADVSPPLSAGNISETSVKLTVIRRPAYMRWCSTTGNTYPPPEDHPSVQFPRTPLPANWELRWSKEWRTPFYSKPSTEEVHWEWPWTRPEEDYTDWVLMMANVQYTCLRMVSDPNCEFFEHSLALMDGWVVGIVSPQRQFGIDDTYDTLGHQPDEEQAADLAATGEEVMMTLTLDML